MNPAVLFLFLSIFPATLFPNSVSLVAQPKKASNVTVIGTVFCDACSTNTFSNHSYFLQGVKVRVECKFRANSPAAPAAEEMTIAVERTTDRYGVYKLEIPPVDGFECREGREMESFCHANLIKSSSPLCSVPGLSTSTEHMAIKSKEASSSRCVYNLNALNYRPSKKGMKLCGTREVPVTRVLNASLFFWPPFLPSPFPHIPFFSPPSSFPFPLPPWFPFPSPPSFPFPFPFPSPPSFPFPFPSPSPPSFPFPFPFPFPSPSPPSLPFPFPFSFPPPPPPPAFPFPLPPLFPSPPLPLPPPSPPTPSFPFPFPPFPPLKPAPPGEPSPPPPGSFSWIDPKTWFPSQPPPSPKQP